MNEKKKESIQRPKTEDRSWDTVASSEKPTVSDLLFEELKKRFTPKVAEQKKVEPKAEKK